MSEELNRCPFCGGKCDATGWLRGDGVRGPECEDCGATAASVEGWSRRAQPAEAEGVVVRNFKTREGYDIWDKLCAIPKYGFLLSPEGNRVVKVEGVGSWIDRDDAMRVVDEAQTELNLTRAALSAMTAERDGLQGLLRELREITGEYAWDEELESRIDAALAAKEA